MKNQYKVRFTFPNGRSLIEGYATARRAKEVVALTHGRHAAADTKAEYLGRDKPC